ncbi:MAG: HNH endonuclease [Prevotellaceae bacterium]|nr:HNH endonuclease [Prevotellaceae bacterium]
MLKRLWADFKNKCYLCEAKAPTSINVEHFRPHEGRDELKYDWNNLYFSCSHCNNTKTQLENKKLISEEGLLDCTCEADRVDEVISYRFSPWPTKKVKLKDEASGDKALSLRIRNTIMLLDGIYNGTDTQLKTIEAENLLQQLQAEVEAFQDLMLKYKWGDEKQRDEALERMREELGNASAFTAFKRWMLRDDPELASLLLTPSSN